MFYNTGIATYIWVLTNKKPENRKGKVQLIDATQWLATRRNLGQKNCELRSEDIQRITDAFLSFEETEQSKIFPNEAFGYWKVTVERPLRLKVDLSPKAVERFHKACDAAKEKPLAKLIDRVVAEIGPGPHLDFGRFEEAVKADAETHSLKLTAKRLKFIQSELSVRDELTAPVIRKKSKLKKGESLPDNAALHGQHLIEEDGKQHIVEYEADSDLRDNEQIPLFEDGRMEAFIRREVLPDVPDAWIDLRRPLSVTRSHSRGISRSISPCEV